MEIEQSAKKVIGVWEMKSAFDDIKIEWHATAVLAKCGEYVILSCTPNILKNKMSFTRAHSLRYRVSIALEALDD